MANNTGRTPSINEERERKASTPVSTGLPKAATPKKGVAAKTDRYETSEQNKRIKRATDVKESARDDSK